MPAYDFICGCGATIEVRCSISQRNRKKVICPNCGQIMRRLYGAPALHGEAFQFGLVLGDGTKIKGTQGKEAKRERKK